MRPFGLAPDAPVAVAVSGGPDSMALLVLAADEAQRSGRVLHALTVDHGLRADAGAEARQVGRWAQALGVPHTVLTHTGDAPRASVQAAARGIRYRLMADWCAAHDMAALLVAHTREDQAETFLLRLARGSGVDGLSAMATDTTRNGMRLLRPLLDVREMRCAPCSQTRGRPTSPTPPTWIHAMPARGCGLLPLRWKLKV